ncbi:hypothetical protein, partial [Ensifer adhaerens]|uniref:hypothetical protein n=1 Tax=Ensifer adhaerens TaxID=106592 RepID=UPI001AEF1005
PHAKAHSIAEGAEKFALTIKSIGADSGMIGPAIVAHAQNDRYAENPTRGNGPLAFTSYETGSSTNQSLI